MSREIRPGTRAPDHRAPDHRARTTRARTTGLGPPGLEAGMKDGVSPQKLFSDLGLKYVGPVDGHDIAAMRSALSRAKGLGGPVIVHVSP